MKKKAILLDLDGTLLPLIEKEFTKYYFGLLCKKMEPLGYESQKLIDSIWDGTKCMIMNDGSKTNEEVFWDRFKEIYGDDVLKNKDFFDDFYKNEFKIAQAATKENPYIKEIMEYCRKHFEYVILATNPIFPGIATRTRLSWIGLSESDFDLVTYYENSSYAKPNPNYYQWILDQFQLDASEAIMVGNDEYEDYCAATKIGIDTIVIGDYINRTDKVELNIPHYKLEDFTSAIDLILNKE